MLYKMSLRILDVSVFLIGVLTVIEVVVTTGWPAQVLLDSENADKIIKNERYLIVVPK
jgi:hypothetical protein